MPREAEWDLVSRWTGRMVIGRLAGPLQMAVMGVAYPAGAGGIAFEKNPAAQKLDRRRASGGAVP